MYQLQFSYTYSIVPASAAQAAFIIIIIIITHLLHENKSQVLIINKWQICKWNKPEARSSTRALHVVLFLANDPQCSSNLSSSGAVQENDAIAMTYSITYSGNWAPIMRWFNSVTRHNFTDDITSSSTNDVTTVTSQLTVTASTGLHGSEIVCVTYFIPPSKPLLTSATNAPSYANKWTSPTLDVHCK